MYMSLLMAFTNFNDHLYYSTNIQLFFNLFIYLVFRIICTGLLKMLIVKVLFVSLTKPLQIYIRLHVLFINLKKIIIASTIQVQS